MENSKKEIHNRRTSLGIFCFVSLLVPSIIYFPLSIGFQSRAMAGLPTAVAVILAVLSSVLLSRFDQASKAWIVPTALVITLCLGLTDRFRHYFYYWEPNFHYWFLVLFTILLVRRIGYKLSTPIVILLPFLTAFMAVAAFYVESNGRLIFSDDFPPLMYRLEQLKSSFPKIPFYNPLWNAGVEAREFLPSGSLNIYFLFYPLIQFLELTSSFNFIVAAVIFVIVPLIQAFSVKIAGGSRIAQALAATLALGNSILFYRWGLVYGTLPFLLSISLLPLIVSTLSRIENGVSPAWILLLFVATTLSIFWSPTALLLGPLYFYILVFHKGYRIRPFLFLIFFLAVCNLPWMTLFMMTSKVQEFVSVQSQTSASDTLPATHTAFFKSKFIERAGALKGSLNLVRDQLRLVHPFLLCLCLPALIVYRKGKHRNLLVVAILLCLLMAVIGPIIKPQLELQRFWLIILMLCLGPISVLCDEYLASVKGRTVYRVLLLSLLLLIPVWLWGVVRNKSGERYKFASPTVSNLTDAIKKFEGRGRVLFAGFILHELSGGHVAPLAGWTQVPLMASRYQHDRWTYTDIIPESFRNRGDAGVEEFLDLYNVSTVVTHDKFWRKWFASRPERYKFEWEFSTFKIYSRISDNNTYFLSGNGEILGQENDRVRFSVADDEVVIKFTYLDSLVTPGCQLRPEIKDPAVVFIRLVGCPKNVPLELKMMSPFERLYLTSLAGTRLIAKCKFWLMER